MQRRNQEQNDLQMQLFQMNEDENKKKSQRQMVMELSRIDRKPFQMVHISILREYLILDMGNTSVTPSFKVDPERLIDDFILLCFFCGNDFLPHMPTLDIREGALNLLISIYQHTMPTVGHLSKGEHINMRRMEIFVSKVSMCEQAIFQKRKHVNARQKTRQQQQLYEKKRLEEAREKAAREKAGNAANSGGSNKDAAALLRSKLSNANASTSDAGSSGQEGAPPPPTATGSEKDSLNKASEEEEEAFKKQLSNTMKKSGDKLEEILNTQDRIRLGEDGWKYRYYEEKFHAKPGAEQDKVIAEVVQNYVEGLSWVMKYYYQGCPSWSWYFAYHYAPFASDLKRLDKLELSFSLGEPFKPLDQLMAVLPPASSHCMPKAYKELMTSKDSLISDFYPETFPVDPNGKRYSWQHIALLPFIDEKRLLDTIRPLEETLNSEETRRNSLLSTLMVIHKSHPLAWSLIELEANSEESGKRSLSIQAEANNHINGTAVLPSGPLIAKVVRAEYDAFDDIVHNQAVCFGYAFPPEQVHIPRLLKGCEPPRPRLRKGDDTPCAPEIWHETSGGRGGHRQGRGEYNRQGGAWQRNGGYNGRGRGGGGGGGGGGGWHGGPRPRVDGQWQGGQYSQPYQGGGQPYQAGGFQGHGGYNGRGRGGGGWHGGQRPTFDVNAMSGWQGAQPYHPQWGGQQSWQNWQPPRNNQGNGNRR